KPESRTAVGVDQAEERGAFFIVLPGAVSFEAEKFADAKSGFALAEIGGRNVVASEVVFGQVHSAEAIVFGEVADDVGELKGKAKLFGEIERARIAEAENMRAGKADGPSYAVAVFLEAREGSVGADREIHFSAGDEVVEIARGHVVAENGAGESG